MSFINPIVTTIDQAAFQRAVDVAAYNYVRNNLKIKLEPTKDNAGVKASLILGMNQYDGYPVVISTSECYMATETEFFDADK